MPVDLEERDAQEYEVEAILNKHIVKGETKYLVR